MRDRTKRWLKRVAAAAIIGLVVGYLASWPTSCPHPKKGYEAGEQTNDDACVASNVTLDVWRWAGENKEPVEAFSVLLTAIFTGTLFWATVLLWRGGEHQISVARKAAKAANRSAKIAERTLTDLERPWIFPGEVIIKPRKRTDIQFNDWWVSVEWRNVGRAPARLDRIVYCFRDIDLLPENPDYTDCHIMGVPDVLPHGDKFETQPRGIGTPKTNPDGSPVEYVFYGRFIYREMNGREHHSGFAYRLSPYGNLALVYEGARYTYYD